MDFKEEQNVPGIIVEYASVLIDSIKNGLSFDMDLTGDTLPVLDHHINLAKDASDSIKILLASTAGAYFGEVLRKKFGGKWFIPDENTPSLWDLRFESCPLAIFPVEVAFDIIYEGKEGANPAFRTAPARFSVLEDALNRTAMVPEEVYYSFSGRMDALHFVIDFLTEIEHKQAEEEHKNIRIYGDQDPAVIRCKEFKFPDE